MLFSSHSGILKTLNMVFHANLKNSDKKLFVSSHNSSFFCSDNSSHICDSPSRSISLSSLRRLRESRMDSSPSEKFSALSISENAGSSESQSKRELHLTSAQSKGKAKAKSSGNKKSNAPQGTKLRGRDNDSPEVRTSKTISWLLRHGAENEGLPMRSDGYVRVTDMACTTTLLTSY